MANDNKLFRVDHWNCGESFTDIVVARNKDEACRKASENYGCKIHAEYVGAIESIDGYKIKLIKED